MMRLKCGDSILLFHHRLLAAIDESKRRQSMKLKLMTKLSFVFTTGSRLHLFIISDGCPTCHQSQFITRQGCLVMNHHHLPLVDIFSPQHPPCHRSTLRSSLRGRLLMLPSSLRGSATTEIADAFASEFIGLFSFARFYQAF
jgi:hypothetical protein